MGIDLWHADPEINNWVQDQVTRLLAVTLQVLKEERVESVVVSGSLSGGEFVAVREAGEIRPYSDLDARVLLRTDETWIGRRVLRANLINKLREAVDLHMDISLLTPRVCETRIGPSIDNVIVGHHGRTIWGSDRLLNYYTHLDWRLIPFSEFVRLVCNRVSELVKTLDRFEVGLRKSERDRVTYQLGKLILDVAFVLLLSKGIFEPTYKLRGKHVSMLTTKSLQDLKWSIELVERATSYRFLESEVKDFKEEIANAQRFTLYVTDYIFSQRFPDLPSLEERMNAFCHEGQTLTDVVTWLRAMPQGGLVTVGQLVRSGLLHVNPIYELRCNILRCFCGLRIGYDDRGLASLKGMSTELGVLQ